MFYRTLSTSLATALLLTLSLHGCQTKQTSTTIEDTAEPGDTTNLRSRGLADTADVVQRGHSNSNHYRQPSSGSRLLEVYAASRLLSSPARRPAAAAVRPAARAAAPLAHPAPVVARPAYSGFSTTPSRVFSVPRALPAVRTYLAPVHVSAPAHVSAPHVSVSAHH